MTTRVGSYRDYGIRQATIDRIREDADTSRPLPARVEERIALAAAAAATPFVGVTTDGKVIPNLFSRQQTGISTRRMRAAATAFLAALPDGGRGTGFAIDAPEWRKWFNGIGMRTRHGTRLLDLAPAQRELALELLRASLSERGFELVRAVMQCNEALGEIAGEVSILNQWQYHLSIFGTPSFFEAPMASADEPWGWQIDGHHLIVNCFVLGDQVVLTPTFMGAEPNQPDSGTYAGLRTFEREEQSGLELVRALSSAQQERAILYHSTLSRDLPPERNHPSEGRMRAGALQDNLVSPYEGLRADTLSRSQQALLLQLIETYVGIMPPGHDQVRMSEIKRHLHETYFTWIGATDDVRPFFYRVQSPVILIEFDHHRGVVLDNDEPERFHAHTVVRTPNGNDYGRDLLRQHYERFHNRRETRAPAEDGQDRR